MTGRRQFGDPRKVGTPTGRRSISRRLPASSAPSTTAAPGVEPAPPLWQRIYTVAFGLLLLACAVTIATLVVAGWQGRDARFESPLALVTMAAATVVLGSVGLWILVPARYRARPRFAAGFGVTLFASMMLLVTMVGAACLLVPNEVLVSSGRGPRTVGSARVSGAVLLTVVTLTLVGMYGGSRLPGRSTKRR